MIFENELIKKAERKKSFGFVAGAGLEPTTFGL